MKREVLEEFLGKYEDYLKAEILRGYFNFLDEINSKENNKMAEYLMNLDGFKMDPGHYLLMHYFNKDYKC